MITINLRPGLKRKTAGSPLAAVGERLRGLQSRVKDPMLMLAVGVWILVAGWLGWMLLSNARELAALEPRLEQARAENRRFQNFIRQKRRQEAIRDSLVAQIEVIRSVDGDRYVWPHILDEVAKALPDYTWLVSLSLNTPAASAAAQAAADSSGDSTAAAPKRVPFELTGRTVDIQAYTRFLRQLEASPWVAEVTPTSAETVIEQERAVTAFTIRASYVEADSAYVRTVPLTESVR